MADGNAQEVDDREATQQDVEANQNPGEVDRFELKAEHEGHYRFRIFARPVINQGHYQTHSQNVGREEVTSNLSLSEKTD